MRSSVNTEARAGPQAAEPRGYLHVATTFAGVSRRDVEQILIHEVLRAHRDSAVSDIIAIDDDGAGGVLVSTSTEHLAHRLGHAIFKAFGGELHHGFGLGNRLALVWWRP